MSSAAARLRTGIFARAVYSLIASQLERGERTEDHVDVVALDQLLGLGLGATRVPPVSGDHEPTLRRPACVVLVLQEADGALLHLDTAGGEAVRS